MLEQENQEKRKAKETREAENRNLVKRIRAGDKLAESEAFSRYWWLMKQAVRRYTNCEDDLNDVLSITCLTALPKLRQGDLRNPEALDSYLCAIARNVALGELRKRSWLTVDSDRAHADQALVDMDTPEQVAHRTQLVEQALDLVRQIPVKRDRLVIEACAVLEREKQEVCTDLGLHRIQLARVLSRARKRLRGRAGELVSTPMAI
ncbi:MAG: sigma-70 family RNA polymerase sigma factor [Verrucomicrobiota bacterium]